MYSVGTFYSSCLHDLKLACYQDIISCFVVEISCFYHNETQLHSINIALDIQLIISLLGTRNLNNTRYVIGYV